MPESKCGIEKGAMDSIPQAVWNPDTNGKNVDKTTGGALEEGDTNYQYMKVNMGFNIINATYGLGWKKDVIKYSNCLLMCPVLWMP